MNTSTSENYKFHVGFAGHDSFALRHGWLEKAYYEVERSGASSNPFSAEDSIIRFGVGKNMVNGIRHWALASKFIEKTENGFAPTSYATEIMTVLDPYLENPSTLWKIHYEIAKNPANTTIHWIFSYLNSSSFSRDFLERKLMEFCVDNNCPTPAAKTLRTDTTVSLAMYCAGKNGARRGEDEILYPLQELGLLRLNTDGTYSVVVGAKKTLGDGLLAGAMYEYWAGEDPHSASIKLDTLLYNPGSPGRIFALSESELVDRVARISEITNGMLEVSETAGIVQIFKNQRLFKPEALKEIWGR